MKYLLLSAILSFNANAVLIDDFDTGVGFVADGTTDGFAVSGFMDGVGIIGGQRDVSVELLTNPFGSGSAEITVNSGFFSANTPSGATGRFIIQWDGDDAGSSVFNPAGLGSVDFLASSSALAIDLAFSDLGSMFELLICTNGGLSCDVSSFDFLGFPGGGTRIISWDDAEFDGLDFSDVSAFQATIIGDTSFDLSIDAVATTEVAEPNTLALMGMSLLLLARRLRKK